MTPSAWSWQKLAIVAAAAAAVIAIGFLSGNTGPVQGLSGGITLLRTDKECLVSVEMHLSDAKSANSNWFFFASPDYCAVERDITDGKLIGREPVSKSIKAVTKR